MAILCTTSYDKSGNFREFLICHSEFEAAIDLVNVLVRKGNCQLVSVYWLVDSNRLIPLAVEAFDGEFMGESLALVQQEWESILS